MRSSFHLPMNSLLKLVQILEPFLKKKKIDHHLRLK